MADVGAVIAEFRSRNGTARVGKLMTSDGLVWVKQPGPAKGNRWNRLHAGLSSLVGGMFRSTAESSGPDALHAEAERLRRGRALGLAVPDVIHDGDGVLVLSDCGEPLGPRLKREANPAKREALLLAAIHTLANFHRAGMPHGRPFIKDMSLRGDTIHLLDFEEDPLRLMSLPQAKARDLWLFLQSASRFTAGDDAVLGRLLAAYDPPGAEAVHAELRRFVRLVRPVSFLANGLPKRWLGSDLRAALQATRAISLHLAT